jgi:hypothetical protein
MKLRGLVPNFYVHVFVSDYSREMSACFAAAKEA